VYKNQPHLKDLMLDEQAVKMYDSLDGIPHSILQTVAAADSKATAADMTAMLVADKQGYVSTRHGSAEAACGCLVAQCNNSSIKKKKQHAQ
jgi:hypothetical protein